MCDHASEHCCLSCFLHYCQSFTEHLCAKLLNIIFAIVVFCAATVASLHCFTLTNDLAVVEMWS